MGIRVLVIDDSATARAMIREVLSLDSDIEVVGVAPDVYIARDKILSLKPDILCLDVEMPKMDGITFLKKLMIYRPMPVVMVSSLTQKGAQTTLEALASGAVDFVAKGEMMASELASKVKQAAKIKIKQSSLQAQNHANRLSFDSSGMEPSKKVIAIGASTGGTKAIQMILESMPTNCPGIVIVQHMPGSFTKAFADRLNDVCAIKVCEAKNGECLEEGKAIIADGEYHMALRKSGNRYFVELGKGEKVSGHRPSVDVLFNSIAQVAGRNSVGILLTGMGQDGARGLLNMRKYGARTIAQDEASCVVFGMPRVAIELGGAEEVHSLNTIASRSLEMIREIR